MIDVGVPFALPRRWHRESAVREFAPVPWVLPHAPPRHTRALRTIAERCNVLQYREHLFSERGVSGERIKQLPFGIEHQLDIVCSSLSAIPDKPR
jgi:hypothetical protein